MTASRWPPRWWSIRLARADAAFRQRTPAEVARAIELAPENGEYLAALALQAEYSGQDSTPLLEEIARLNPRSSAPRIRLGLAAELRGDTNTAERWLQEAYSVDRQFETRWTLANFYFRQGQPDEFWTWMKSALEMSYGDRVAAFDLCWQMTSNDPEEILDRAIPDRREVVASYLAYVLNHHQPGRDRRRGESPRKNSHCLTICRCSTPPPTRYSKAGKPAKRPICGRLSAIPGPKESLIRISRSRAPVTDSTGCLPKRPA